MSPYNHVNSAQTSPIPDNFALPTDIEELLSTARQPYNFRLELDIKAKYTPLKKVTSDESIKATLTDNSGGGIAVPTVIAESSNNVISDAISSNSSSVTMGGVPIPESPGAREAVALVTALEGQSISGAPNSIVPPAKPPKDKSSLSSGSIAEQREAKILEMMQRTGEDRSFCSFYLESFEWDLDKTISFFKDLVHSDTR